MAPEVGLESTVKRKRKHLQSTAGTEEVVVGQFEYPQSRFSIPACGMMLA